MSCPQLIAIDSDRHCVYQYPYRTDCNYCTFSMLGSCYRPQRSWAKVIFYKRVSRILSTGGGEGVCLSACWDTPTPPPRPGRQPPGPGRQPPGPGRHPPPEQTPPDQADYPPPGSRPPRQADSSIRSTSGRYASYWNAFLFVLCLR